MLAKKPVSRLNPRACLLDPGPTLHGGETLEGHLVLLWTKEATLAQLGPRRLQHLLSDSILWQCSFVLGKN